MAKESNTSNLQSHLKNHHPLKFAEITQAKNVEKPTISNRQFLTGLKMAQCFIICAKMHNRQL